ncbi:hypothetical protein ACH3VR_18810, partial [Microbacterium sp. B2969]
MKGDEEAPDALDRFVGERVWQRAAQLGGWGTAVQRVSMPPVAIPPVLGMAGSLGHTLLVPAPARAARGGRGTAGRPAPAVSS